MRDRRQHREGSGLADLDEADLVAAYGEGRPGAFEELYHRHAPVAWRTAAAVLGTVEGAVDAVVAAFAWVLMLVPREQVCEPGQFRSCLLAATRDASLDELRKQEHLVGAGATGHAGSALAEGAPSGALPERDAPRPRDDEGTTPGDGPPSLPARAMASAPLADAFRGLPERWRTILWLTEAEGVPVPDAAGILGVQPSTAVQLAKRARSALTARARQLWLSRPDLDRRCPPVVRRLDEYAAGGLGRQDRARVGSHLAGCPLCRSRLAEIDDLGGALRSCLVPLPLSLLEEAAVRAHLAGEEPHREPGLRLGAFSLAARKPLASVSLGLLALGIIGTSLAGQGAVSSRKPHFALPELPGASATVVQPVAGHHRDTPALRALLARALSSGSRGRAHRFPGTGSTSTAATSTVGAVLGPSLASPTGSPGGSSGPTSTSGSGGAGTSTGGGGSGTTAAPNQTTTTSPAPTTSLVTSTTAPSTTAPQVTLTVPTLSSTTTTLDLQKTVSSVVSTLAGTASSTVSTTTQTATSLTDTVSCTGVQLLQAGSGCTG